MMPPYFAAVNCPFMRTCYREFEHLNKCSDSGWAPQGSLKREGTTANDVFVLVKSAESHLIPSKYVGKSLPPTLS